MVVMPVECQQKASRVETASRTLGVCGVRVRKEVESAVEPWQRLLQTAAQYVLYQRVRRVVLARQKHGDHGEPALRGQIPREQGARR